MPLTADYLAIVRKRCLGNRSFYRRVGYTRHLKQVFALAGEFGAISSLQLCNAAALFCSSQEPGGLSLFVKKQANGEVHGESHTRETKSNKIRGIQEKPQGRTRDTPR